MKQERFLMLEQPILDEGFIMPSPPHKLHIFYDRTKLPIPNQGSGMPSPAHKLHVPYDRTSIHSGPQNQPHKLHISYLKCK